MTRFQGLRPEPLLMVEEFSHRVVNEYAIAIAAISFEAARLSDDDARATLGRTIQRLQTLAEAHRVLRAPVTADEVPLGEYLDRVCAALSEASLRERGVRLMLVEDITILPAVRCWRVALIVAELITNAVKHGFKEAGGMILVEVRQAAGEVVCTVSDNGGCATAPLVSRGRHIVERIARELGGEIRWLFAARGVTATLSFPLSPNLVEALD